MNEKQFEEILRESLALVDADPESVGLDPKLEGFIADLSTFEEIGASFFKGLMVRLADGTEFRVTIVKAETL